MCSIDSGTHNVSRHLLEGADSVPETGAPTIEATNLSQFTVQPRPAELWLIKPFKSPTVTFSDEILESSPEKPVEV